MRLLNQMIGKESHWKHAYLLAFQHLESIGDLLLRGKVEQKTAASMIEALQKFWFEPKNENLSKLYDFRHNSRANQELDRIGEHCMDIALARLTIIPDEAR